MSQENVEVARRLFESRDPETFYGLLDEHVVFINRASFLESRPSVGHEGVRDWVRNLRETLGDYRIEVTDLIDAGGDQVIAECRYLGTGAKSGVPFEGLVCSLCTLVNGKVVRVQGFDTRTEALEAAGLSE